MSVSDEPNPDRMIEQLSGDLTRFAIMQTPDTTHILMSLLRAAASTAVFEGRQPADVVSVLLGYYKQALEEWTHLQKVEKLLEGEDKE